MTLPVFPMLRGLTYPMKRTPIWSTLRQKSVSGREATIQLWTFPRWRYELVFEFLRSDFNAEFQTLVGFINSLGGSAQVFRFTDPDDGAVTDQLFGAGDSVTTDFQLIRALGGFNEPVFWPSGVPIIKKAGVIQTLGTHYTISATGLVSFVTAPTSGQALSWSGSFDWLCRFDADENSFEKFMDQLWSGTATFTTVKP